MDKDKTALERAFELARSGRFKSVVDLRACLDREGYYGSQIHGRQLMRQLRDLMKAAPSPEGSVR